MLNRNETIKEKSGATAFLTRDDEVSRLRAENQRLKDDLEAFRQEFLGDYIMFPRKWRLTQSEERIFACLLANRRTTRQQLLTAAYRFGSDEPDTKIIDVYICKIRQKLKPYGIEIMTIWGIGYFIEEPRRKELRALYGAKPLTLDHLANGT